MLGKGINDNARSHADMTSAPRSTGRRSQRGRVSARVLAIALVIATAGVALVAQPSGAVTTAIALTPSVGPPTTHVTVKGSGFGTSETVALYFGAAKVATVPSTITTSSTGSFTASFNVTASAPPGNSQVKAVGQTSALSATHNFLVRTDWNEFHFDPANTGDNPYENTLAPSNVSGLKPAWSPATGIADGGSVPAVAGGVVYVLSTNGWLYTYSADGSTGCSGTPPARTCAPLWTGTAGSGVVTSANVSSPTVAGKVVYVGSGSTLYAFNAGPNPPSCSGTPPSVTCPPLWTAATGGSIETAPVVAAGVVYVTSGSDLYAFSATAKPSTCSAGPPKVCPPLWTATTASAIGPTPAVAGGVVYVSTQSDFYAFNAGPSPSNCSGTPPSKTCPPLWKAVTSCGNCYPAPAVAGGVVYLAAGYSFDAYSAGPSPSNCSGTSPNITCPPLWSGAFTEATTGLLASPAVANGFVYESSSDGKLYAFKAGTSPTNCFVYGTTSARICPPLWTAFQGNSGTSSPAVADGVVYSGNGGQYLYAFDASGAGSTCSTTTSTGGGSTVTYSTGGLTDTSKSWTSNQWNEATVSVNGGAEIGVAFSNTATTISATWSSTPAAGSPYTVSVTTCSPLATMTTGSSTTSTSPAIVNGMVYIGTLAGKGLDAFGL